jgi:membrane associated rhomboid family serine protease
VNRDPFIVGPRADKFLGFLVGAAGSIFGWAAAIVVMFMWVGSDREPDFRVRRRHATSVSRWSGVGCAIPAMAFVVVFFVLLFVLAIANPNTLINHTFAPPPGS